ncbi:MAG: hypothetical protein H0X54_01350 [Propionibacteriales bacterium]|jgi:hypothetical protein|nr:hypothetical protein [Propionibacteriales bacterium]
MSSITRKLAAGDRPTTHPSVGSAALVGAKSAGASLAANLAVLGVATLAGADMLVRPDANKPVMQVGVILVAATTLLPLLLATMLLIPARRWGARGWRALAVAGLVVGVVSVVMPLGAQARPGTQLALASMHVITGVAWFLVVRRATARLRTA